MPFCRVELRFIEVALFFPFLFLKFFALSFGGLEQVQGLHQVGRCSRASNYCLRFSVAWMSLMSPFR
jgi:hypothetical protein